MRSWPLHDAMRVRVDRPAQRAVLLAYAYLADNKRREVRAPRSVIATSAGLQEAQVQKVTAELIARGLLVRVKAGNNRHSLAVYRIPTREELEAAGERTTAPSDDALGDPLRAPSEALEDRVRASTAAGRPPLGDRDDVLDAHSTPSRGSSASHVSVQEPSQEPTSSLRSSGAASAAPARSGTTRTDLAEAERLRAQQQAMRDDHERRRQAAGDPERGAALVREVLRKRKRGTTATAEEL